MKTKILVVLAILAVFLNFGFFSEAREVVYIVNPNLSPSIDTRILVAEVDIPNQQITLIYKRDDTKHVYLIDLATVIKAQGNTGTIKDITVGQQVYNYVERDNKTLDSIEVATAQKFPAAPKE